MHSANSGAARGLPIGFLQALNEPRSKPNVQASAVIGDSTCSGLEDAAAAATEGAAVGPNPEGKPVPSDSGHQCLQLWQRKYQDDASGRHQGPSPEGKPVPSDSGHQCLQVCLILFPPVPPLPPLPHTRPPLPLPPHCPPGHRHRPRVLPLLQGPGP